MSLLTRLFLLVVIAAAAGGSLTAQQPPTPPKTPRVYIFDNGKITGLDPSYSASRKRKSRSQTSSTTRPIDPKGTLMFDSGAIPDAKLKADGAPVTEGVVTASRQLKPQMAAAGYKPGDVT